MKAKEDVISINEVAAQGKVLALSFKERTVRKMTEEIKDGQKEVSEIVTLVSGSRESINSAIELKKQYPQSRVDLLHVTGVNWNHADSFPVDIMYMYSQSPSDEGVAIDSYFASDFTIFS